jgi:hypothetical protein
MAKIGSAEYKEYRCCTFGAKKRTTLMADSENRLWPRLWRGALSSFGALAAIATLLSLSDAPGWIAEWSRILNDFNPTYVVYAICAAILVATNLPWASFVLTKKGPKESPEERHRKENEIAERLDRARTRIRELAEEINITGMEVRPKYLSGPVRDPLREPIVQLRAMLRPEISKEYENCLKRKDSHVSAKMFLEALADTVSASQLRE